MLQIYKLRHDPSKDLNVYIFLFC